MKNYQYVLIIITFLITIATIFFIETLTDIRLSPEKEWPKNIDCKGEDLECLVFCIREVETGGEPKKGCEAIGDNGDSHGPYQIQQNYIDYASKYDKSLKNKKATDLSGKTGKLTCDEKYKLSEKIIKANLAQGATANKGRKEKTWTCEDLARNHNGGPTGYKRDSTKKYWEKIEECKKTKWKKKKKNKSPIETQSISE